MKRIMQILKNKRIQLCLILFIGSVFFLFLFLHRKEFRYIKRIQESIVEEYFGKRMILPDTLPILYNFENSLFARDSLLKSKYKICTCIWSDCRSCLYELIEWQSLIDSFKVIGNVNFLFYTYTSDYDMFIQELYPEISFHYPIILDTLNLFCTLNNINPQNKLCNTFLLDEDNEVILIGNPIMGKAIKQLYYNTINRK